MLFRAMLFTATLLTANVLRFVYGFVDREVFQHVFVLRSSLHFPLRSMSV